MNYDLPEASVRQIAGRAWVSFLQFITRWQNGIMGNPRGKARFVTKIFTFVTFSLVKFAYNVEAPSALGFKNPAFSLESAAFCLSPTPVPANNTSRATTIYKRDAIPILTGFCNVLCLTKNDETKD